MQTVMSNLKKSWVKRSCGLLRKSNGDTSLTVLELPSLYFLPKLSSACAFRSTFFNCTTIY